LNKSFTTIIGVYINDRLDWFQKAIDSILNQSIPPKQIVLVKDGPISIEINDYIKNVLLVYEHIEFTIHSLNSSVGRGNWLNTALKLSNYELVSHMDSDDISRLNRFEKQLEYLNNNPDIDVLGGIIEEFNINPGDTNKIRKVYSKHDDIFKSSKNFCPMNNVTVMYKKDPVLRVGGFSGGEGVQEDYILWVKMLSNGYKFSNIKDVIVDVRVGNNFQSRRKGFRYINYEIKMQKIFYDYKHISMFKMIINITLRSIIRLMPARIIKLVYYMLRTNKK
tara:strand:+ start:691 stop:1524 length:834 start_codon:yes stop_codon:yes gene_type:complete